MTNYPTHSFDYLVFIGRFQPLHYGHVAVIQSALARADKVIIMIGSSNLARSIRNPFTYEERRQVIEKEFYDQKHRIIFFPLEDYTYNEAQWLAQVQNKVNKAILNSYGGNSKHVTLHGMNDIKVGLIGCNKDNTSYYLKLFPQWDSSNVCSDYQANATDIRLSYFNGDDFWKSSEITPVSTYGFLEDFKFSEEYKRLVQEQVFVDTYKKAWEGAPYEPQFITVDAVVVQSGHVLMVRRKAQPGEGQLALPGGFVNSSERLEDAVLRELKEETRIKVPLPVLKGSMVTKEYFDDPHRSMRGRTLTHAFLFKLKDDKVLPKVKGSDDAAAALWVPLSDLKPQDIFEDHYFIIQKMIGEL